MLLLDIRGHKRKIPKVFAKLD